RAGCCGGRWPAAPRTTPGGGPAGPATSEPRAARPRPRRRRDPVAHGPRRRARERSGRASPCRPVDRAALAPAAPAPPARREKSAPPGATPPRPPPRRTPLPAPGAASLRPGATRRDRTRATRSPRGRTGAANGPKGAPKARRGPGRNGAGSGARSRTETWTQGQRSAGGRAGRRSGRPDYTSPAGARPSGDQKTTLGSPPRIPAPPERDPPADQGTSGAKARPARLPLAPWAWPGERLAGTARAAHPSPRSRGLRPSVLGRQQHRVDDVDDTVRCLDVGLGDGRVFRVVAAVRDGHVAVGVHGERGVVIGEGLHLVAVRQ